ncbi:MAG TPA: hypothetical protein VLA49_05545 [Anaerolineales bacterium]|nr:hypothetical protein [Anaerolineales bacterium]
MKVKACTKCGKHNSESAWNCTDCGETLSIKTLVDTDSGQLLNVTPIAGHTTLSEISAYFEQDVVKTLKTNVRIDESINWGVNYAILSKTPPYVFGYFIITSKQLIFVQFVSDIKRDKVASGIQLLGNPLKFLVKELSDSNVGSTHPWTAIGLSNVAYPSQQLTPTEKDSRKVIANDLNNFKSVRLVSSWYKDTLIKGLIFNFEGEDEFTITFYSPYQAENAYKLITEQLNKSFP